MPMFSKKKSVKRIKVVQPRASMDDQRAPEEEVPLMGRSAARNNMMGGAPSRPIADRGNSRGSIDRQHSNTNQGRNNVRRRKEVQEDGFCGGYPYNIIIITLIVIAVAVGGCFIYKDLTSIQSTASTTYAPSSAPTIADSQKTDSPTLADGESKTDSPTLPDGETKSHAPTHAPTTADARSSTDGVTDTHMPTLPDGEKKTEMPTLPDGEKKTDTPTLADHDKTLAPTQSRRRLNDVVVETTPAGPVNSPASAPAIGTKKRLRR